MSELIAAIPDINESEFSSLVEAEKAWMEKTKADPNFAGGSTLYITSDSAVSFGIGSGSVGNVLVSNSASTAPAIDSNRLSFVEVAVNEPEKPAKVRAEIIFEYVKSNFNKLETEELQRIHHNLSYVYKACVETGQVALKELTQKKLAQVYNEQLFRVKGFDKVIDKKFVDFFREKANVNISFDKLENFPRVIPDEIRSRIQEVLQMGIFDEFFVLHINPKGDQLKTNAEQIKMVEEEVERRKKDPILFGISKFDPNRLFFVVDWVDEVCDLTFEVFVDKMHKFRDDFNVESLAPLTVEEMEQIKEEVINHDKKIRMAWGSDGSKEAPTEKKETFREKLSRILSSLRK